MDTIYALSSGKGRAGVAVVRVSGDAVRDVLARLSVPYGAARLTSLRRLVDRVTGEVIDQALVVRFDKGASFTGEDIVELHAHGSQAVVRRLLSVVGSVDGTRPANPGEFTQRAVLNGRMDVAQAEALADLIDSDTERQRQRAMRDMEGAVGKSVAHWRRLLRDARAMVAAAVDFADEGDVGEDGLAGIDSVLQQLRDELSGALKGRRAGRVLHDGFRVALFGRPNAGKSTLLNALAGSDIAIVSDVAGTTRDVLDVRLEIDGWPVIVQDMAGVRDQSDDPVERIGIDRALRQAHSADLILHLMPADDGSAYQMLPDGFDGDVLVVRTKVDAAGVVEASDHSVSISARTGFGLDVLREQIAARLERLSDALGASPMSSARQFDLVEIALNRCCDAMVSNGLGVEFLDDALMRVDHVLGRIVGHIGVEDVLDDVFSRFCIGK